MGSKQAGLEVCKSMISQLPSDMLAAIVCPDDVADTRTELNNFKLLADSRDIPLHVVKNVSEMVDIVRYYNPSIVLVHGWYQLIPVADFSNTLFLGFHYSPLPKYRGNAPLVWQIINGEELLGVSLFQLTEGMDEGDLIEQKYFNLSKDENISCALNKANELAQVMLTDFLGALVSEKITLKKQPSKTPSYCGLRLPEDGLIDWNKPAYKVHDFIRAQSKPYPGAFTYLPDGRKLTIWVATEEQVLFYGAPGGVVSVNSDYVVVACAEGAIRVIEIEVDGQKECSPSQILKSMKTRLS